MKSEGEIERAVELYADTVKRLCAVHLKNQADTEDIFQTVFLKYALCTAVFQNEEYEKAWFIRVTINACKDLLKSFFRKNTVPLDGIPIGEEKDIVEKSDVLNAVLSLPQKYREVVYLHYYEGYTAKQIGEILKKRENTVYTLLNRAKGLLKDRLGGESYV